MTEFHRLAMFAQAHFPHMLDPAQLDRYLEGGWFRMGQTIFTTNFLNFSSRIYSALWLRIDLHRFAISGKQARLTRQNSRFRSVIRPAVLDEHKELLYARYKQGISFEASPSLQQLMFGTAVHNVYRTLEICLYDDEKLIACGFFDLGFKSAAGISSFYDPDYKKFSPGKHLIYQKINYCINAGFDFFYPGYFVSGYPFFDYKLEIGGAALEYYEVVSGKWMAIEAFSPEHTPIKVMTEKLNELNQRLLQAGIRSEILKYEYFDANILIDSHKASLFDFPIFIQCADLPQGITTPVVYNIYDNRYQLLQCGSLWSNDGVQDTPGSYSSYLLRVLKEIFAAIKPDDMVSFISSQIKAGDYFGSPR